MNLAHAKRSDALELRPVAPSGANENFEVVADSTTLFNIIARMRSNHVSLFLVASGLAPISVQDVKGVISKERIADAMTETQRSEMPQPTTSLKRSVG